MKAIETRYKGYRFRSRLEARWAVFFDALKIKWDYEPEGFELKDGGRYLPDFFLSDHKLWVEIKPGQPTIEEAYKAKQLVLGTKMALFLSAGMPDVHGRLIWPEFDAENEEDISDCVRVSAVWSSRRTAFHTYDSSFGNSIFVDWRLNNEKVIIGYSNRLLAGLAVTNTDAINAARGARFEFGVVGA